MMVIFIQPSIQSPQFFILIFKQLGIALVFWTVWIKTVWVGNWKPNDYKIFLMNLWNMFVANYQNIIMVSLFSYPYNKPNVIIQLQVVVRCFLFLTLFKICSVFSAYYRYAYLFHHFCISHVLRNNIKTIRYVYIYYILIYKL